MQLLISASEESIGLALLIPLGGACRGDLEDLEKLVRNKILMRKKMRFEINFTLNKKTEYV